MIAGLFAFTGVLLAIAGVACLGMAWLMLTHGAPVEAPRLDGEAVALTVVAGFLFGAAATLLVRS